MASVGIDDGSGPTLDDDGRTDHRPHAADGQALRRGELVVLGDLLDQQALSRLDHLPQDGPAQLERRADFRGTRPGGQAVDARRFVYAHQYASIRRE